MAANVERKKVPFPKGNPKYARNLISVNFYRASLPTLPGAKFRERNSYGQVFGISDEMDTRLEKKILEDLKIYRPPSSSSKSAETPGRNSSTDSSLLSTMAARLTRLEEQVRQQQKQMQEKDRTISELINKMPDKSYDQLRVSFPFSLIFKQENEKLKHHISEIESFLSDYGLEWVGGNAHSESAPHSPSKEQSKFPLDLEKLRKAIRALNQLAGILLTQVIH